MMFDRTYRQRLEADLARWEADGVITPAAIAAIRIALPPLSPGINIAVVVAIVGGLLIAAAFLAFVAAHWIEIARLLRLAILFAGILTAHGLGAWFARAGQPVLADLCAARDRPKRLVQGAELSIENVVGDDHLDNGGAG